MARKKREPRGPGPKKQRENPPLQSDRRAMESMMHQFVSGFPGQAEERNTPLGKAQALMDRAFEESNETKRIQLANDALALSANCADAYVLLGEHTSNRKEACHLFEQGVAAGERALGAEAFQRDVGHFWGLLETRPYMRARLGLAIALWSGGRRDEAVPHLQDMLRLNPGDNQGVRYTLADFLQLLDRDDELTQLLGQYDEDSATWAYAKALLAFRQHGDTPETRQLLSQARKTNKHVPAYLCGEKLPPSRRPDYIGIGDENEASDLASRVLLAWKSTLGAVAWLRKNMETKKSTSPQPQGPQYGIKKWLNKNLKQKNDVWQADFQQTPGWIKIAGNMVRPWTVLVTSRNRELVLGHQMLEAVPSVAQLWESLTQAMIKPTAAKPHRPTELQVRADERWESLRPHLNEIGIQLVVTDNMNEIGVVFRDLNESVGGKPRLGLLEMPAVTTARVGGFYRAAAFFFDHAPWKKVDGETVIKVECNKFQSGPWYAVVMGQSGMTMGLVLYEDLNELSQMLSSDGSDGDNARQSVATFVTFGEEWTIPVADLNAVKVHGWQVARPDAYPDVLRKERGSSMRAPLVWELELMEGCLRAIPEFVLRHANVDRHRVDTTVPVASGELKLILSWVDEDDR